MSQKLNISDTRTEIFNNGIMTRLSDQELQFIKKYENDPNACASPGLLNIYGDSNNKSDYPSYISPSDMPFKHIMPIVNNGQVVGYGWRTLDLDGTSGPDRQPNRGKIEGWTTEDAIKRTELKQNDPEYITPREAMFIIRARHGMEKCDINVNASQLGGKLPRDASIESMARADIQRNKDKNSTDKYGHYGSSGNNTSFNSSGMQNLTDNQLLSRRTIKAVNDWSDVLESESKKPLSQRRVFETIDQNGLPTYIIKDPNKDSDDKERWKPFFPNTGFLDNLSANKRGEVLEEIDHNISGKNTRNPNDNTFRAEGPTLSIFKYVERDKKSLYKQLKVLSNEKLYWGIMGSFVVTGLLGKYGRLSEHTLHTIFHVIEAVSVTLKTTKNTVGQFENPNWKDWFNPLTSPLAPIGLGALGLRLATFLTARGLTVLGLAAGPIITGIIIALEMYLYYRQKKGEENKLRQEAEQNGWLPGPYIYTNGQLKIPVKRDGNNYKIPIGVDPTNGAPLYMTEPIASIINPTKTKDTESDYNNLTYTDIDDNNIASTISLNDDKNNSQERDILYGAALTDNVLNGFTIYSYNDFNPPELFPEERRWIYENRWVGDEQADPTRNKSPLDRLTEADPFGDWSQTEIWDFFNRLADPYSDFYGYSTSYDGAEFAAATSVGRGSDFIIDAYAPTIHWPNIQNGNSDRGVRFRGYDSDKPIDPATGVRTCFPSVSMVLTPTGLKNISNFCIGDLIISYNREMKIFETSSVIDITRHEETKFTILRYNFTNDRALLLTDGHPILTDSNNFIRSNILNIGDGVLSDNGIVYLKSKEEIGKMSVYNLVVDKNESYIVDGIIVRDR